MESININSNINLYYIPMTKLKTTTIGVYIHRELNENEVSENALLPYVLKRGCRLCPDSADIARYLENLYGAGFGVNVLKRGDSQIMYLGFETISDKYARNGEALTSDILKLAMSLIFEPVAITEKVVEQEKKNAGDRIMAEMNDKAQYAVNRCTEEMCKGERFALSRLGTVEGIDKITADSLKKHYENIITSSVIDIYICGSADTALMAKEIKNAAESVGFKKASLTKCSIFTSSREVQNVTDKMDVAQGKLCMGFKTGVAPDSDDYIALMVASSVYGGGAHSKLFNNVREKLSLCYYASSSLVKNKGIMYVNAGIEFDNFQKAYDEILAQLENIKNGEISELEFTSSINAILNQLESYRDEQSTMQLYYLDQKIAGTNYDIDELKEKISRVTIEEVKKAASKIELDTVYFLTGKEEA